MPETTVMLMKVSAHLQIGHVLRWLAICAGRFGHITVQVNSDPPAQRRNSQSQLIETPLKSFQDFHRRSSWTSSTCLDSSECCMCVNIPSSFNIYHSWWFHLAPPLSSFKMSFSRTFSRCYYRDSNCGLGSPWRQASLHTGRKSFQATAVKSCTTRSHMLVPVL